ncbi:sensor domain-containing phosphodiesterase [Aestuariibacter halophilus]|uniref:Sensor domain-containing phosphodiesterase n=1 Tax=Fluctibacter halophilus TaxID=226011 RepID=A0ABS8G680_9ALTE|nr:sensor domain-containing phosphodiesterase [Aestuariibacter halophilus]MCC2615596.1 sensor domain-containing phosphodiesterase [Aestuariibacter halophilus]
MVKLSAKTDTQHEYEQQRLHALNETGILDSPPEQEFDAVTDALAKAINVPICLVSIVDEKRQWFKSRKGLDVCETDRDISFCTHALNESSDLLVVNDALSDPRFKDGPLVLGPPHIRAYAGKVLRSADKYPLGTLCVIDTKTRVFTDNELALISLFAELVEQRIFLRQHRLKGDRWLSYLDDVYSDDPMSFSAFKRRLEQGIQSDQIKSIIVGSIDLPKIKTVARNFGQDVANECLAEIKRRLTMTLATKEHLIARCDVNKYVFAVISDASKHNLFRLSEDIEENIGTRIQTGSSTVFTPIKIGLTSSEMNQCDDKILDDLVENSRIALDLIVENEPGVHFSLFTDKMRPLHERMSHIVNKLPNALQRDLIQVHYQPKVRLDDYRIVGAEALIRWFDDKIGYISPLEILDAASSLELTKKLDMYVIEKVAAQYHRWLEKQIEAPKLSLNITETTLLAPQTVEQVASILGQYEERMILEFEILEDSFLEDCDFVIKRMEALARLGIHFSLDDFGTGYSSLAQLTKIPIKTLKIDKSFIRNMIGDVRQSVLAHHIIQVGHSQGLEVVAEGVETYIEQVVLKSFGCDVVQGYYFAKPLPHHELEALLLKNDGYVCPNEEKN